MAIQQWKGVAGEVAGRILGQGGVGVRKPGSVTEANTLGNRTEEPIMSQLHHPDSPPHH